MQLKPIADIYKITKMKNKFNILTILNSRTLKAIRFEVVVSLWGADTLKINIKFEFSFWKWLMLFAYRRIAKPVTNKPFGVPFNRDPENICESYEPRKKKGDWDDCQSDGHYLCKQCCHLKEASDESN